LSADTVATSADSTATGFPAWSWFAAGGVLAVLLGLMLARRLTRE
jgi:hypothetical protein